MRHRLAILILALVPTIMLSACDWIGGKGSGNASGDKPSGADEAVAAGYELPGGGGFDRERFRGFSSDFCRSSLARAPAVLPDEVAPLCACVTDRLLRDNDDALRAMIRDLDLAVRRQDEAVTSCRASPLPGAAHPVANLASYVSADDYPAAALRNNEQGQVAFILDIGADGRVTNCRIRETSGSAVLDSATCRIMRSRARYTPARDAQGVAVTSHAQANVRWVLPPE